MIPCSQFCYLFSELSSLTLNERGDALLLKAAKKEVRGALPFFG